MGLIRCQGSGCKAQETEIRSDNTDRFQDEGIDVWTMGPECHDDVACGEEVDTHVPQVPATEAEFLGKGGFRFFDERSEGLGRGLGWSCEFQVAKA